MSRYYSYLNSTKDVLRIYRGEEPLSSFLKKYFSSSKKFGSRDRKQVSNLCYCFFRLGKAVMNTSIEEKILTGLFICSAESNETLAALKPGWNEKCKLPLSEKLLIINSSFLISEVFPWEDELSEGMDHEKFCASFFIQPELFLRLRPGKDMMVKEELQRAGIDFRMITESCLALPNASKIDEIIGLDKEAVVQDYSSQRTGEFIESGILNPGSKISLWDCCAGSGGKTIMLYDIDSTIDLTVSDIRESIISNLEKRFEKAGINNYKSFVSDLTVSKFNFPGYRDQTANFKLIIADVPCSGSGTWSRTPEQLYFFDKEEIGKYSTLQKKIVSNAIPHLEPGGSFVYITCSVFKKENEELVEFIKENFHLKLKQMEVLKGYDKKADSMFVAVLEKEL